MKVVKVLNIIALVLLSLLIVSHALMWLPRTEESYNQYKLLYFPITTDMTKEEVKEALDSKLSLNYKLTETNDLDEIVLGSTNMIDRHIQIRKDLDILTYGMVLTHEMMHLKYFTGDERFVNYVSFIFLFENDLVPFAERLMVYVFSLSLNDPYNCTDLIYEYLKLNNITKYKIIKYS